MGAYIGNMRLQNGVKPAWRALRANPAVSLIAMATLALGIGANTAIFSVVDAVLLRPLPYPHPGQLVEVRERTPRFSAMSDSLPDYYDWRKQNQVFSHLAAWQWAGYNLTGPRREPKVIQALNVTANLFPTLGVRPYLGRNFKPADDQPGAPRVAMLGYRLWSREFGANPRLPGKTIVLDGQAYSVIGVMPPGFDFPGKTRLWVSLGALRASNPCLHSRGCHPGISALGRLRPGVSLARAQSEMSAIAARLAAAYPKSNTSVGVELMRYQQWMVRGSAKGLWMLLGAVGLMLLIACANIANLLLARAEGRRKEFAIRAALGATRWQIVRQLLGESLGLALAGGGLGLVLALLGMHFAQPLLPKDLPRATSLGVDWRVLLFSLSAALLCGILFGLAPAWLQDSRGLSESLNEGGRESHGGGHRLRGALVAGEMALALLLLAGAGLLLRSFYLLIASGPGFDPAQKLTFTVGLPDRQYHQDAQQIEFYRAALAKLAAIPGVTRAALIMPLPFSGSDWENTFQLPDRAPFPPGKEPLTDFAMASPGYFRAMKIPLLRGRNFRPTDTEKAPPVAIVDTVFARRYWPGQSPLGKQVEFGRGTKDQKIMTIVGMVRHIKLEGLAGSSIVDRLPELYVPYRQQANTAMTFVLRAGGAVSPLSLLRPAEEQIHTLDPNLAVAEMHTMGALLSTAMAPRRLALILTSSFAGLSLLLAAVGIYGVISYSVAQRQHELGVRMALGAQRGSILRLVLGEALRLTCIGAGAGLAAALALGKTLSSFLFSVHAYDPLTLSAGLGFLFAVAVLASYLPARRGAESDPARLLKSL